MPNIVHDLYCCTHTKSRRSLNGNCVFCIYDSYYAISKHMTTRHMLRCKQHALIPSCIQFIKQDMFQCITRGVWAFHSLVRPSLLTNGNFKVTQPISNEAWLCFKHAMHSSEMRRHNIWQRHTCDCNKRNNNSYYKAKKKLYHF